MGTPVAVAMPDRAEDAASSAQARAALFEANRGQFKPAVDYLARAPGMNVALAESPVIELYRLEHEPLPGDGASGDASAAQRPRVTALKRIQLRFRGADGPAESRAMESTRTRVNYLSGDDPAQWRTGVRTYCRVRYPGIYEGVDVDYFMDKGRLEFALRLEPGADPGQIVFDYKGARGLTVADNGDLLIDIGERRLRLNKPIAYQSIDEERHPVEVAFRETDEGIGFRVGEYDIDNRLTIDPVLDYSSYYGGSGTDEVRGVETDADQNIFMFGQTTSVGLATSGVYRGTNNKRRAEVTQTLQCPMCSDSNMAGEVDRTVIELWEQSVYVAKFTADGGTLLYHTYFNAGGSAHAELRIGVNSIGVSDLGEPAFALNRVPGLPSGLPLKNEVQGFDSARDHHYVAKLNSSGSDLEFATYLQVAGSGDTFDIQRGLDVDGTGEVVAVGAVGRNNNFPEFNALPNQSCTLDVSGANEFSDGYVIHFGESGGSIMGTCLGGDNRPSGTSAAEWMRGVRFREGGNILVVGYSGMTDFPTVNAYQSTPGYAGSRAMTITEIDPVDMGSSSIVYSTYFGPSTAGAVANEGGATNQRFFPIDIAEDSLGNVIVTGTTNELHYPVEDPHQRVLDHPDASYGYEFLDQGGDMFVTSLNTDTNTLNFSTYLGGSATEDGLHDMAVGPNDNIYLVTVTRSPDYPTLAAYDTTLDGETDLAVSKLSPDGRLTFSTYLGGTSDEMDQSPGGVAVPNADTIVVAGNTAAADFPTLSPMQGSNGGEVDATLTIFDQSGDMDTDTDGVIDSADAFPAGPTEWRDTDGDGTGNNMDGDDDGDGRMDANDSFPLDGTEQDDMDGDGAGDNADLFDSDPTGAFDKDGDGSHDFADSDSDGDGTPNSDEQDEFVLDPGETRDFDFDGVGDNADVDADNDGAPDSNDPADFDANEPVITFNLFDPFRVNRWLDPLPAGFSTPSGADTAWTAALDAVFSGERSLGSLNPGDGGTALVEFNDTFDNGRLQFRYKVESESGGDFLDFSIDGTNELSASGDTNWQLFTAPITAGSHTLEWSYSKDGSGAAGADAAWIDDIQTRTDVGDISVTIDNSLLVVPAGMPVVYQITVTNNGPSDVTGVSVNASIPPELMNASWACTSSSGATCGSAGGSGGINTTADLTVGSSVTYDVTADAQSGPEEPVTFLATITTPAAFEDTDASDDAQIDEDMIGVFGTGFE